MAFKPRSLRRRKAEEEVFVRRTASRLSRRKSLKIVRRRFGSKKVDQRKNERDFIKKTLIMIIKKIILIIKTIKRKKK